MKADRLFCGIALAERVERAEAQLIAAGSEAAHRRTTDTAGFVLPIAGGVASFAEENSPHEEFPRAVVARAMRDFTAAGVLRYIALRDGVIAGGASYRLAEGVAQFTGAATAPEHRRHGVQTALLSAR